MTITVIDTPVNVTRYLPRLTGIETIIRYITRGAPNGSKQIKLPEVQAIKRAGKKLALVHETYGDFRHAGRGGISAADGAADGRFARAILPKLGAPAGSAVYFAVDTDGTAAQLRNNVLPYFKAIHDAFADGEYRVGIYGPGRFCKAVKEAGFADLTWLANAKGWSGYRAWLPHCDLLQGLPTHIAGGLDVDPNTPKVEDWGQFEPFSQDADLTQPVTLADADTEDVTVDGNDPTTPRRLAQGEATADAHEVFANLGGAAHGLRGFFSSKIAWFTGMLGGSGVATTVASDPEAQSLTMRLLSKPTVWMGVIILVLTALLVYQHWKRSAAS